jgi:CubicO group peptidase (beta-lactamase class C family)
MVATGTRVVRTVAVLVGTAFLLLAPVEAMPALATAQATPAILASIDEYVDQQMAELHIPGLALALIVGGTVAYERGYGVADPAGRAVTPHTPFIIGSTSKQFTGIAIEQLVRGGRLDQEAPFSRYVPWFSAGPSDAHAQITVRELLSHTSGLSGRNGANDNALEDGGPTDTLEANARRLAGESLGAAPGSRFEYTDANYNLLGYLIEVVSGQPYATYMQQHVFAPLGLHDTYTDQAAAQAAGLAAGYYRWFDLVALPTPMPYPRSGLPSGYLISSADDLATLALAQLGRVPAGQTDVDAALLAATRAPLTQVDRSIGCAAGWWVHRFWHDTEVGQDPNDPALPLAYEHGGTARTYRTFIEFVPDAGFGLVLAMNTTGEVVQSRWGYLSGGIERIALGRQPVTPVMSESPLRQYAKPAYLLALVLQLAVSAWSLRAGRRRRLALGTAIVVNLAVLALELGYAPLDAGTNLLVVLRLTPDLGLMTVASVGLALTWFVLQLRRIRMA